MRAQLLGVETEAWSLASEAFGGLTEADILAGVGACSARYTRERERLGDALSREEQAARLLFLLAADLPKVEIPLSELARSRGLPDRPLRLLDLGAGLGASSLGVCLFLARHGRPAPARLVLADRDEQGLALARRLLARMVAAARLPRATPGAKTVVADLRAGIPVDGRFDLVLVGQVLNELWAELPGAEAETRRADLLVALLAESVEPDGSLIVIEPALRDETRALHRLRQRLLERGAAWVFAPCLHQGPCPMLAGERDWCHERRDLRLPPRAERLAHRTGLRQREIRMSYLTLRRDGGRLRQVKAEGPVFRVVSEPLRSKGKLELLLCGERWSGKARCLARVERGSPASAPFGEARRGDLLFRPATPEVAAGEEVARLPRLEPGEPWSC